MEFVVDGVFFITEKKQWFSLIDMIYSHTEIPIFVSAS